jgi:hypothetical protein
MKRAAVVLLALAAVVVLLRWRGDPPPVPEQPAASIALPSPPQADQEPAVTPVEPLPPVPGNDLSLLTPAELRQIRDAVDAVELTLRDHALALGGNPVGTNAEITAALLGDNARQLKLDIPAGSSLNEAGELCDPWGTPWFFHQIDARKMELRSAGPDRKLYTDDDFVR